MGSSAIDSSIRQPINEGLIGKQRSRMITTVRFTVTVDNGN